MNEKLVENKPIGRILWFVSRGIISPAQSGCLFCAHYITSGRYVCERLGRMGFNQGEGSLKPCEVEDMKRCPFWKFE